MAVVVQVWDLAQAIPLGYQKVTPEILQMAQELAEAQGRQKVTLWDLDSAQVQAEDLSYQLAQVKELAQVRLVQGQELAPQALQVQGSARESALPQGYRLDSEQGLVRDFDSEQVQELG